MHLNSFIDYTLLKPIVTKTQWKEFVNTAKTNRYRGICTFWEHLDKFEPLKALELSAVSVVVGFPFGEKDVLDKLIKLPKRVSDVDYVPNLNNIGTMKFIDELRFVRQYYIDKTLKVIIETELLNKAQIEMACKSCNATGVDYIKTCTGFNGKLSEDKFDIVVQNRGHCKVKVSGGISDFDRANYFITHGAAIVGTSAAI